MKFQSGLLTGRSVSLCYTMTLPGIATIDIAERRAGSTAFSLFLFPHAISHAANKILSVCILMTVRSEE